MILWSPKGGQKLLSRLKTPGTPLVTRYWPEAPGTPIEDHGAGYGVLRGILGARDATLAAGYCYAYADGPYWLRTKQSQIRLAWGGHQFLGEGPDIRGDLEHAGCVMREQQKPGDTIWICTSADAVHREMYKHKSEDDWVKATTDELRKHTDRPIQVRSKLKSRLSMTDYKGREKSMDECFASAWAIVACGSTIAVEAVCRGVPVFVTDPCASAAMGRDDLSEIENPWFPTDEARTAWAENLAARQHDVEALASGWAWEVMQRDLDWLETKCPKCA